MSLIEIQARPESEVVDNKDGLRLKEVVLADLKALRQQDLDEHFHTNEQFAVEHPDEAESLKKEFLLERAGMNIGERFALLLTPKYFGKIFVGVLASTNHDIANESSRLYDEYKDLLRWLKINNIVEGDPENEFDGELPRNDVTLTYTLQPIDKIGEEPIAPQIVVTRQRLLLDGEIALQAPQEVTTAQFSLYKQTTFIIPASVLWDLSDMGRRVGDSVHSDGTTTSQREKLNNLLHTELGKIMGLVRVRTEYLCVIDPEKTV